MALRNPNKPHIKMVNGYWVPEYAPKPLDWDIKPIEESNLVARRNINAWAFCNNYLTSKQMVMALEDRGICSKR